MRNNTNPGESTPETMTKDQIGVCSFIAGAMFWCLVEMIANGIGGPL